MSNNVTKKRKGEMKWIARGQVDVEEDLAVKVEEGIPRLEINEIKRTPPQQDSYD